MLRVYNFSDASKVSLSPLEFEIDDSLNSVIDEVWANEQERHGKHLFNGKILSAMQISSTEIKAVITEYKYYLAKKSNPMLFSRLKIKPIAVSGLLECRDGFVFGKRSINTIQDAGNWELVPSGSIDCSNVKPGMHVDFKSQLLVELKEEVGIDSNSIKNMKTFCYVLDEDSFVLDIGISLYCDLYASWIKKSYSNLKVQEYEQLAFIKRDKIPGFFRENSSQFVQVSRMLLNRYFGDIV
jgi:hypothetical protein